MIGSNVVWGMSIAELAVLVAALAWLVDRVLDRTGLTPSATRLREENLDLVRQNGELEALNEKYQSQLVEQSSRITMLEAKVEELEKRDQAAVLAALDRHETMAERRYQSTKEDVDRRHSEALSVLKDINETQRLIAERLSGT